MSYINQYYNQTAYLELEFNANLYGLEANIFLSTKATCGNEYFCKAPLSLPINRYWSLAVIQVIRSLVS